jgi:hypothetical protein
VPPGHPIPGYLLSKAAQALEAPAQELIESRCPAPVRRSGAGCGKISYTYDLGACWEHQIALEQIVTRDPDQDYPLCVAYKGDSPVEYWSEDDSEEPEPFNLAEVNRKLAALSEAEE